MTVGAEPEKEIIKLPDNSLIRLEIDSVKHTTRVVKLTADGAVVANFAITGSLKLPFETRDAQQVCVDPRKGDVVFPVAASPALTDIPQGDKLLMAKMTADGQMPGEYGFKKKETISGYVSRCVMSALGDIVVGISPSNKFLWSEGFYRSSSDGTPDSSFGAIHGIGLSGDGSRQTSSAMALDRDDRLLVASQDGISGGAYFGRLTTDGEDDLSFNWSAFYRYPLTDRSHNPRLLGFQPTLHYHIVNRIIPLPNRGMVLVGSRNRDMSELRISQLKPNGDLETQFNQTGQYVLEVPSKTNWAALTSTGHLLAFTAGSTARLYNIKLAP
jgi:hypothetical protein